MKVIFLIMLSNLVIP